MTAQLIDGAATAARLRAALAAEVTRLGTDPGPPPGLAVVLVGDDPASRVYVANKDKAVRQAGMQARQHSLPAGTSQDALLALLASLAQDDSIHGILVQLPLPDHICATRIINAIPPAKDVDGFHLVNAGRLTLGLPGLVPCTPLGCQLILRARLGDMAGLHALVLGRSHIVGKPMATLLLAENCTVTIAHSRTRNLPDLCREADILVAAIGQPRFVQGDWIKPGATVLDVGINRCPSQVGSGSALVGDVDFATAVHRAGAITPVPGGIGPMTIACLLANTLTAYCQSNDLPAPDPFALLQTQAET